MQSRWIPVSPSGDLHGNTVYLSVPNFSGFVAAGPDHNSNSPSPSRFTFISGRSASSHSFAGVLSKFHEQNGSCRYCLRCLIHSFSSRGRNNTGLIESSTFSVPWQSLVFSFSGDIHIHPAACRSMHSSRPQISPAADHGVSCT